jgi:hypothetical protein
MWIKNKNHIADMGEIEKVGHLKYQNLSFENHFEKYWYREISYPFGQNFSIQDEKD